MLKLLRGLVQVHWSGLNRNEHPPVRRVRMRLRRHDGQVYLERWGLESKFVGGIFLHRMDAGDPGVDLHDHPWWFVTVPLVGGYVEERAPIRLAPSWARIAEVTEDYIRQDGGRPGVNCWVLRGLQERRRRFLPRVMRLDECHRITALTADRVWTLVVHGPHRRPWGFYTPDGWVDEHTYDETVRVNRRDLWNEDKP